jgi:DNA invertase Pin-like site-specific DNA recombinase
MITILSLFAQVERVMNGRRTKEALAAKKAQGVSLGEA